MKDPSKIRLEEFHATNAFERKTRLVLFIEEHVISLRQMTAPVDFSYFHNLDIMVHCDLLASYSKFCNRICCPVITVKFRQNKFSDRV